MMKELIEEIKVAAMESPRIYFAPIVGAVKEMRIQFRDLVARKHCTHPIRSVKH